MITIIIPTWNRSIYLEKLLSRIYNELLLFNIKEKYNIIISDNCSDDNTFEIFKLYLNSLNLFYIRNECNIGTDKNLCNSLNIINSKYFWIIGDDDLPINGLINYICSILNLHNFWN